MENLVAVVSIIQLLKLAAAIESDKVRLEDRGYLYQLRAAAESRECPCVSRSSKLNGVLKYTHLISIVSPQPDKLFEIRLQYCIP